MASASDKNKHKEKILEIPDATYQGLEDSHHRQNQSLGSDSSMFQQTVQAPSASTTRFAITQNHHFGGGSEDGKWVIYVPDRPFIPQWPKRSLSYFIDEGQPFSWTKELKELRDVVVLMHGGPRNITPKRLREAMGVEGLTNRQLSRALQKLRHGTSKNGRKRQKQEEPLQPYQDIEDRLNADSDNCEDPSSPTGKTAFSEMYNSLEECIRRPENDPSARF